MTGDFVYKDGGADGELESCPECSSSTVYPDDVRGELVCEECGYILQNGLIDRGAEWSAFSHAEGEEKSRVGSPLSETMHDRGLTTKIHWQDVDAHGRSLSSKKKEQLERLRTWQTRIRTKDASERNLQLALTEINRMSSVLGIPQSAREVAATIYRRALDENLIRGWSIEGVASSSLYIACRKNGIPRSLDEFEGVARVGRTEIGRTYRYLVSELDLEMEPVDPKRYVPRFCSELEIEGEVRRRAMEILDAAAAAGICSGKSPTGLAGAAIYTASLLCDERQTQAEIAAVAQVTEVTIRNRYKEQLSLIEAPEL